MTRRKEAKNIERKVVFVPSGKQGKEGMKEGTRTQRTTTNIKRIYVETIEHKYQNQ